MDVNKRVFGRGNHLRLWMSVTFKCEKDVMMLYKEGSVLCELLLLVPLPSSPWCWKEFMEFDFHLSNFRLGSYELEWVNESLSSLGFIDWFMGTPGSSIRVDLRTLVRSAGITTLAFSMGNMQAQNFCSRFCAMGGFNQEQSWHMEEFKGQRQAENQ
jgi:hypothetical protein